MVKTRSDLKGIRVSAKAPRKAPPSSSCSSPGGRSSRKYEGGNSYCPRETPPWQKEITKFFTTKLINDVGAGSSRSDPDNGVINQETIQENEQNT